ncbi:MAG TPA: two-component regulator propeller domain-containing protein [Bacteroidia bacterium]|nr:two-component regulator propeller domain-containing protein [Bacteroidia bacterium]
MKTIIRRTVAILLVFVSFQTFSQGNWKYFKKEDGLLDINPKIFDVLNDKKNNIWFITDKGILVYDGKSWITYNEKNGLIGSRISTSLIDSKGNIWIGSYDGERKDGGLSVFDGEKWVSYRRSEKIFTEAHVRKIFEDSKGRIWATSSTESGSYLGPSGSAVGLVFSFIDLGLQGLLQDGGVSMFENGKWTNFNETPQKPPYKFVKDIIECPNGKILFNTGKHQLFMYDGNRFVVPGRDDGYSSGDVYDLIRDHNGNIWVGSWDRQVKYDGNKWTIYGKKDGVIKGLGHFWTFRIHESKKKGFIIFAGAQGIVIYDGSEWKNIRYDHVGPYTQHDMETYQSVEDTAGNVWVYYNNNFGVYNGKEWHQSQQKVDCKFFIDSKSRKWLPKKDGLEYKIDGKWNKKEEYQDIFGFVEDRSGNIWIGMKQKGVVCYDNNEFKSYSASNGLPSNNVQNIFTDSNNRVWFSTDKGLCYYKNE